MSVGRSGGGIPPWVHVWFLLDAVLVLTPPLHWAVTGRAWVLGLPAAIFYFLAVALFICASLIAAYRAEVAAGNFES